MEKNLLQRVCKGDRLCEEEIVCKCALTALAIINSIGQK